MDEFYRPIEYIEAFYNDKGKECVDNEKCFAKKIEKKSDQINAISQMQFNNDETRNLEERKNRIDKLNDKIDKNS